MSTMKSKKWILDCARKPKGSPTCTPFSLKDVVDFDYLHLLTNEELEWLAQFMTGFFKGERNEVSKEWSVEEIRECFSRNNRRKRDAMYKDYKEYKEERYI